MFMGSFVDEQKGVPDQYQWRGEKYLSLSDEGVNSGQQMTKSKMGQVLHAADHDVFEAF